MQIKSVCLCDMGRLRKNNEDNFYFDGRWLEQEHVGTDCALASKTDSSRKPLFCVFDGMGGEEAGELASFVCALKTDDFRRNNVCNNGTYLEELCSYISQAVFEAASSVAFGRSGSTMAGILFDGSFAFVCNAGDSRVYRLRKREFLQLSVDDSEKLPLHAKQKARLTQFIGVDPAELCLEAHISKVDVKKDDVFLICSDGVTDMISDDGIAEILNSHASVKSAAECILAKSLENGGRDNITVTICRIG